MCRFFFLLILVILGFLIIASIFGFSALFWPIIIGLVGSSFGLLFLPKRGDQFAYRNWYRWMALKLMLGYSAVFVLFIAVLIISNIGSDRSTTAFIIFTVAILGGTYALGWQLGPTTRRRSWLKRRYSEVFKAIQRYRGNEEVLENYLPALRINGMYYFLVTFYDRKNHDFPSAYLLLDEHAAATQDEVLFNQAVKCKTLAIRTIDYAYHGQRAKIILDAQGVIQGLGEVFDLLRNQSEIIFRHQQSAKSDLDQVLATEEPIRLFAEATIAIQLIEARWAKDHGLGKLTVVDNEDVENLIEQMRAVRKESVSHYKTITSAMDSVNRLIDLIKGIPRYLPEKQKVIEGLLGITDIGKGIVGQEEYDYIVPSERDLKAWREGTARADKLDSLTEE